MMTLMMITSRMMTRTNKNLHYKDGMKCHPFSLSMDVNNPRADIIYMCCEEGYDTF